MKEPKPILLIGIPSTNGTDGVGNVAKWFKKHPIKKEYHPIIYLNTYNQWKFEILTP
jgi:hypothetical protein